jgi:hypothetical protein
MRIGTTLLVIGIVLTAAAVLHGHDWWFFALETVVKFAAARVLSTFTA